MSVDVHLRVVRKHPTKGTYWQLRWTTQGTRHDLTLGYLADAEAANARQKKEAMLRLGLASLPSTPPALDVERLVKDYLKHLDETEPGDAKYRRAETTRCIEIAEHVGETGATELSEIVLRRLIAGYRNAAEAEGWTPKKNTLLALLGTFGRVVKHAFDRGIVARPAPRLAIGVLTDDARPPRELSQAEVRAIIKAANEHVGEAYARLIQFAAWCPRRPVALFQLRRAHVGTAADPDHPRDQVRIWIERDKAGIGRGWCPLTEPALEALGVQLVELGQQEPSALVWPSSTGVAYTSSSVQREFRVAVKAAGLHDVTFYDLRKFGCTQVYAICRDLRLTQKYSGHKDVTTLIKRYIYAEPGAAEDLAQRVNWKAEVPAARAATGTTSGTRRRIPA